MFISNEYEISTAHKKTFLVLKISSVVFIMLLSFKIPTIVGFLTFLSMINFLGYCWPKMMMGPITGHFLLNTYKFHNFIGPFEILICHLEKLMGRRILYVLQKAKLTICLYSCYIVPSQT